jgi:hypothetical protein
MAAIRSALALRKTLSELLGQGVHTDAEEPAARKSEPT